MLKLQCAELDTFPFIITNINCQQWTITRRKWPTTAILAGKLQHSVLQYSETYTARRGIVGDKDTRQTSMEVCRCDVVSWLALLALTNSAATTLISLIRSSGCVLWLSIPFTCQSVLLLIQYWHLSEIVRAKAFTHFLQSDVLCSPYLFCLNNCRLFSYSSCSNFPHSLSTAIRSDFASLTKINNFYSNFSFCSL